MNSVKVLVILFIAAFAAYDYLFVEHLVDVSMAWLWAAPLIGAGAGALLGGKEHKRQQQIEDADRKLAAETARYSWVTGMQPQQIRRAGSFWGNVGSGALSGFGTGASAGQMFGGGFGGGDVSPYSDQMSAAADQNLIQGQVQKAKNPWLDLQNSMNSPRTMIG